MDDYILKASRLIGEIQQLAVLVHMQTELACEFNFSSNVSCVEFTLAPNKKIFKNRFEQIVPEEIIQSRFYTDDNTESKQQNTLKKLFKVKRLLIGVLKEKKIDYGTLDYTIETVEYKRYVI